MLRILPRTWSLILLAAALLFPGGPLPAALAQDADLLQEAVVLGRDDADSRGDHDVAARARRAPELELDGLAAPGRFDLLNLVELLHPADAAPPDPKPGNFAARVMQMHLAVTAEVRAAMDDPDRQIPDVRGNAEWLRQASTESSMAGHIPGALHMVWTDVIDPATHRPKTEVNDLGSWAEWSRAKKPTVVEHAPDTAPQS